MILGSHPLSDITVNFLHIIGPIKNPVYNICDILGVKILKRLRVKFSSLNEHRFRHNFECLSPACICGAAREDTEHYLMHYPQFCTLRHTLHGQVSEVSFDIANMTTKDLCYLLLYGKPNGSTLVNRMIFEATLPFLKSSKRFA